MNGTSEVITEKAELDIQSVTGDHECRVIAWVVPHLPVGPSHIFSREDLADWVHLQDIPYDSLPRDDMDPAILLGTDCVLAFRTLDERTEPGASAPVGLRSQLGWSVIGPTYCHVTRGQNPPDPCQLALERSSIEQVDNEVTYSMLDRM